MVIVACIRPSRRIRMANLTSAHSCEASAPTTRSASLSDQQRDSCRSQALMPLSRLPGRFAVAHIGSHRRPPFRPSGLQRTSGDRRPTPVRPTSSRRQPLVDSLRSYQRADPQGVCRCRVRLLVSCGWQRRSTPRLCRPDSKAAAPACISTWHGLRRRRRTTSKRSSTYSKPNESPRVDPLPHHRPRTPQALPQDTPALTAIATRAGVLA
jgi:hypothetical protein